MPEKTPNLLFVCIENSNRSQMAEGCPTLPAAHRLDWDLPDPKNLPDDGFRAVRDRIEGLIAGLLKAAGVPAAPNTESRP